MVDVFVYIIIAHILYVIVLWCVKKCCYLIGKTALHHACIKGHEEVTKLLINNKVDVTTTDNVSDYVAIIDFIYVYPSDQMNLFTVYIVTWCSLE